MPIHALIAEIFADVLFLFIIFIVIRGSIEEVIWSIKERRSKKAKTTIETLKDPPKTIEDLMLILSQKSHKKHKNSECIQTPPKTS